MENSRIFFLLFIASISYVTIATGEKVYCPGSDDGQNSIKLKNDAKTILSHFQKDYANCTIVKGNLELVNIKYEDLLAIGDLNLNFLANIEEVTGYLLLVDNLIRNISLPKLRIVWGDKHFVSAPNHRNEIEKYSFLIKGNAMKEIHMPNLRAVYDGQVGIIYNPHLCHWKTIDFRQLLGSGWKSRLKFDTTGTECIPEDYECVGCEHCFGSTRDLCQKIYRDDCASQCPSDMCYNKTLPNYCCNTECASGCFGPSDKQCYDCQKFKNNGKCVDKCPPKERYNRYTTEYEPDPDGKLAYNRMCVDTCPEHMRIYKDGCVSRCPLDHFEDESLHCKPCTGNCPKKCVITETVTELNIRDFENCTNVEGKIELRQDSFKSGVKFNANFEKIGVAEELKLEHLELMSNVKSVTDNIFIQTGSMLKSLKFLRNLRVIEGRTISSAYFDNALTITGTDLEELGLVSLRSVKNGNVLIRKNHRLCYVDSLPFKNRNTTQGVSPNFPVISQRATLEDNGNRTICEIEGKVCHDTCDPSTGCWGPGSGMCFQCKMFKLGHNCVHSCRHEDGNYVVQAGVCAKCDPQCLTCEGPSARNCTKCRNVLLDGECFDKCPESHYLNKINNTCEPCHENCFSFGCTGPGNFVGPNGCKKCRYALLDEYYTIQSCLPMISSDINCQSVLNKNNYFFTPPQKSLLPFVDTLVCQPCHPLCNSCSTYGTEENIKTQACACVKTAFRVYRPENRSYCSNTCPENYYNITPTTLSNSRMCYPCDANCDGCFGKSSSECVKCKDFKIMNQDLINFNCTKECPPELQYSDSSMVCSDVDKENIKERQNRKLQIVVAAIASGIFVLLIIVCVVAFVFRRRARTLSKLKLPDEMYDIIKDAKPDLSRLNLIRFDSELKIGEFPLGHGAFGVVYKGVWIRPDDKMKVPVAIKVLHEATPLGQQEMIEEAGVMARMGHPHLVRLIGVCMGQQMMLVTPLMPLGNLLEYVQKNRSKIGSDSLLRWCVQIASGMNYLEQNRLVHRDLAARNILVQHPYHVRVSDFGLAKMLDYGQDELKIAEGKLPVKWLALECLQYKRFTHKSDVWAYGVTVWELLTFGDKPYSEYTLKEIPFVLERGERLPQPKICTLDIYMILIKCWMIDADSRPSFEELFETFTKLQKDPGRYLVIEGDKFMRLPSYSAKEQCDLVRNLVNDQEVCGPNDYLDDVDTSSLPSTPTKHMLDQMEIRTRHNPVRNQSTSSHRYASDPLRNKQVVSKSVVSTDTDNYLIPDSLKSSQDTSQNGGTPEAYTPVVTAPSELAGKQHTYYNEMPLSSNSANETSFGTDNMEYMIPDSARSINNNNNNIISNNNRVAIVRPQNDHRVKEIVQTETVV